MAIRKGVGERKIRTNRWRDPCGGGQKEPHDTLMSPKCVSQLRVSQLRAPVAIPPVSKESAPSRMQRRSGCECEAIQRAWREAG